VITVGASTMGASATSRIDSAAGRTKSKGSFVTAAILPAFCGTGPELSV
jgi:hypothetical protein